MAFWRKRGSVDEHLKSPNIIPTAVPPKDDIEYVERAYLYRVGKKSEQPDNKVEIMLCPHYAKNQGRTLVPDSDVILIVDAGSGTDDLLPMYKEIAIAWRIPEKMPEPETEEDEADGGY